MAQVVSISDASFSEEVLKSPVPVVLDFYAEWCAPCIAVLQTLEDLALEVGDAVKLVKMDADECVGTAAELGVRGLPALFVFRDGQVVERFTGGVSKSSLKACLSPTR